MSQIWNLFHKERETDKFDRVTTDDDCLSNSSIRTLDGDHNAETDGEGQDQQQHLTKKLKGRKKKQNQLQVDGQMVITNETNSENRDHSDDDDDDDDDDGLPAAKHNQVLAPMNISNNTNNNNNTSNNNAKVLSPISTSSPNSLIFERSVQDQGTLSSISRRNSTLASPQLSQHPRQSFSSNNALPNFDFPYQLQRTQSSPTSRYHQHSHHHKGSICAKCLACNSFPDHLNSEAYIPGVLDASTEALSDKNTNLENLEVIKSVNPSIFQYYLDPKNKHLYTSCPSTHYNSTGGSTTPLNHYNITGGGGSLPVSRRDSSISPIDETGTQEIDYSNHCNKNQLNFCSFNDLVIDELEQQAIADNLAVFSSGEEEVNEVGDQFNMTTTPSPCITRRNSSILILPALNHYGSRPSSSATAEL